MTGIRTTADVLERNVRLRGPDPAFLFEGRVLSHAEFAARSFALSHALLGLGLARQSRVAILSQNRPEYFEVFAACGAAGLITVNLNWRLAVPELLRILADCEPEALIFDEASMEAVRQLRGSFPMSNWIALDAVPGDARSYEALIATHPGTRPPIAVSPDDIESLIYTSGTTGLPKGVMLSHRALLGAALEIAFEGGASAEDRMLIVMPLFHVGGKIEQMAFWLIGAVTVLHRTFDASTVLAALSADRVTAAHLAPTMIARLLDHPTLTSTDTSLLRCIHYASAPMPLPLLRRALDTFGPVFHQVYGMTECISVSVLTAGQHRPSGTPAEVRRLSSAGQPFFGVDIRIARPDGSGCNAEELGEILVQGPGLMSGYWSRSALTLSAVRDGWFRTGDIGFIDEAGFLFVADRLKDMIVSGGENIYSREVEDALMSHPAVHEAAVTGIPDAEWGESVKAWVVLREGHHLESVDLVEHCRAIIASYKKPRVVTFMADLPRLFNGKVDKKALRARDAL